jgi:hypothetical protein
MRITICLLLLGMSTVGLAQDDVFPDNRKKNENFLRNL